jgi:hypothetical protein
MGLLYTIYDIWPRWHYWRPAAFAIALRKKDVDFAFDAADRNCMHEWAGSVGLMVLSEAESRQIVGFVK